MPVVIEMGVDLALVVCLIVAFGLLYAWRGIGGPLLRALAALFDSIRIGGFGHYARPFGALSAWLRNASEVVDHSLARLVGACEGGIVMLWHALAKQVGLLGGLLGDLAETLEHGLATLASSVGGQVARLEHAAVAPLARAFHAAVHRLEHGLYAPLARRVDRLEASVFGAVAGVLALASYAYHAVTVTLPARVGALGGRVGRIEREAGRTAARVKGLERAFVPAALAAFTAGALARLGLGWLRCPRVGRVGKQLCGMDHTVLESLLADALLIAGTISLVELARELEPIVEDSAAVVQRFWHAA